MATLIDHVHRSTTRGNWENLLELAITAVYNTTHCRRLPASGQSRYAKTNTVAAIRRRGSNSAKIELLLSDEEFSEFNCKYPLSE